MLLKKKGISNHKYASGSKKGDLKKIGGTP
jgi:hypothetical protein